MALKSRACKATYTFDGNSLKLSASFAKLEALRDHVDSEPIQYIVNALEPVTREEPDTAETIKRVLAILYCLQDDSNSYDEGTIHDAFLGNFADFFSPDNILELSRVIGHLLGQDLTAKLAQVEEQLNSEGPKAQS